MSFKSLLQTLIDTLTAKLVEKSETDWIAHQSIPQTDYVEYSVSDSESITAPFDGVACLFVDGGSANAIKFGRVSSRSVYAAVYGSNTNGMQYVRQWVPIAKGSPIGVSFSGSTSATLRCNPTIGSGSVTS